MIASLLAVLQAERLPTVSRCRVAGVFHVEGARGRYSLLPSEAEAECRAVGAQLASLARVERAHRLGLETCRHGWVLGGSFVIPRINPNPKCASNLTGLLVNLTSFTRVDVYCLNLTGGHHGNRGTAAGFHGNQRTHSNPLATADVSAADARGYGTVVTTRSNHGLHSNQGGDGSHGNDSGVSSPGNQGPSHSDRVTTATSSVTLETEGMPVTVATKGVVVTKGTAATVETEGIPVTVVTEWAPVTVAVTKAGEASVSVATAGGVSVSVATADGASVSMATAGTPLGGHKPTAHAETRGQGAAWVLLVASLLLIVVAMTTLVGGVAWFRKRKCASYDTWRDRPYHVIA
ncbi:unnamed protein product [Lampetra fluviatilis]